MRNARDGVRTANLHHIYQQTLLVAFQGCRRTERTGLRALGVLAIAMILIFSGMGTGSSRHFQAQQPSPSTLTATTLFETQLQSPPPGPATVSVATLALAPGQATLPLEGRGSLLILVESGSVTLSIDHALDGIPVSNSDNADGIGIIYRLSEGQRITIPTIGMIRFHNEGDQASSLLLLSLVSEGEASLLEMSIGS